MAAGNVADQTIEFDSSTGIRVGNGGTSTISSLDIAIGKDASVTGLRAVAIGDESSAGGSDSVSLGPNASSPYNDDVVIGHNADSLGGPSVSIGYNAVADGVAIGKNADASEGSGVAIGKDSDAYQYSTSVGDGSSANKFLSTALGYNSVADGKGAVAIGRDANAPNSYEATFGNLNGQELDLNVTGNATIHGLGGVDVEHNVTADNFVSSGADLAEVYSAEKDYEPGTVVSVSSGGSDVEAASRFDDVAGVVSTDPGFTLNSGEEGVEVALEGRIPVKVEEPVEKGEDLAAGSNGKVVACETSDVSLGENSSNAEIVDAVNSLSSNQDCLSASFGEALEDSENGMVEVLLD